MINSKADRHARRVGRSRPSFRHEHRGISVEMREKTFPPNRRPVFGNAEYIWQFEHHGRNARRKRCVFLFPPRPDIRVAFRQPALAELIEIREIRTEHNQPFRSRRHCGGQYFFTLHDQLFAKERRCRRRRHHAVVRPQSIYKYVKLFFFEIRRKTFPAFGKKVKIIDGNAARVSARTRRRSNGHAPRYEFFQGGPAEKSRAPRYKRFFHNIYIIICFKKICNR